MAADRPDRRVAWTGEAGAVQTVTLPDPLRALPVLAELRGGVAPDMLRARLVRALAEGYRLLGAVGEDGAVVGALGYRISEDLRWGRSLIIEDMVVAAAVRGRGLGTALIAAARAEAAREGCAAIRLCSGLARTDAHRFYEANGFVRNALQFALPLDTG